MFSDIARDDVFRLETARLWLRWPKAGDAVAIMRYASPFEVARWTTAIPHPYPPEAAEQFILRARASNSAGTALHLVATPLRKPWQAIGGFGLDLRRKNQLTLGYILAPDFWGQGFASEAAAAMVEAAFSLTGVETLHSGAFAGNVRSRRVLAKAGFETAGSEEEYSATLGSMQKTVRVKLDRQDWLARRAGFAANAFRADGARTAGAP